MFGKIKKSFNLSLPRIITLPGGWLCLLIAWLYTTIQFYFRQPFGEHVWHLPSAPWILFGFVWIGIGLYLLLFLVLPRLFNPYLPSSRWTWGKEISHQIIYTLLLFIAVKIHADIALSLPGIAGPSAIHIFLFTVESYVMPVFAITFFKQKYDSLRKESLSEPIDPANTPEEGDKRMIDLRAFHGRVYFENEIVYTEVNRNYMEIYTTENPDLVDDKIRMTMVELREHLKNFPQYHLSHESFLVNTTKIRECKGNLAGMQLNLQNCNRNFSITKPHRPYFKQFCKY